MSNPIRHRLIEIVEPVIEAAGFELVDLRFVLEQGGWVLRVQVDVPLDVVEPTGMVPGDGGGERVDLGDCEQLSRELSAVLDVDDPIVQAYHLEVSSPGIDRPLRTARHFAHFTGREAKVQLAVPLHTETGERRNFKGVLRGVADDRVAIECDGARFELPIADVDHAKLVPDWDAVMHGRPSTGATKQPKPKKPGHRPSQKTQKH